MDSILLFYYLMMIHYYKYFAIFIINIIYKEIQELLLFINILKLDQKQK